MHHAWSDLYRSDSWMRISIPIGDPQNPGHGIVILFGSHQHQEEKTNHHSYEDQMGDQIYQHESYPAT